MLKMDFHADESRIGIAELLLSDRGEGAHGFAPRPHHRVLGIGVPKGWTMYTPGKGAADFEKLWEVLRDTLGVDEVATRNVDGFAHYFVASVPDYPENFQKLPQALQQSGLITEADAQALSEQLPPQTECRAAEIAPGKGRGAYARAG